MKRIVSNLVLGLLLGFAPVAMYAQTSHTVDRGGEVQLTAPDNYKSYQWQVSTDNVHYSNLPDGNLQNLTIKVFAPNYYRVALTGETGDVKYGNPVSVKMSSVAYNNVSISGGAHGFVEQRNAFKEGHGIDIPEDREGSIAGTTKVLSHWTNPDAVAVYFLNHPNSTVDTKMCINVKTGKTLTMRVTLWDPAMMEAPLAENYISLKGTGKVDTVPMIGYNFTHRDYYRYQLECISGCENIQSINKFYHYSPSSQKSYKPGYLSSPSVHLNGWRSTDPQAPKGPKRGDGTYDHYNQNDWCYEEVMMPEQSNITGTYVMSLGVLHGYMGIQMNGWKGDEPLHDVIFSQWDDGNTDEDPNLPDYLRANVLDHNPKATATRFGNEGTGMKTFLSGNNWECGKYVQFLTNCRPDTMTYTVMVNGKEEQRTQYNMLVSAWFNAQDGKGWQYMSTLRLPNRTTAFNSWYSFLENYNYPTGQLLRQGYYRNGYSRDSKTKKWYHFNEVGFGHTDGGDKEGQRNDFGQGVAEGVVGPNGEGTFFMFTGGFLPSKVTSNVVPLNKVNTAVDTINLAPLYARVDSAVKLDKERAAEEEEFRKFKLDKSNWVFKRASSQENSGEPNGNGPGKLTIDGDPDTYWHSKYSGGNARLPHYLIVDLKGEYELTGGGVTMSGGTDRYVKAFNFYVADKYGDWKLVHTENDAPNQAFFRFKFDKPANAKFFKFEITETRCPGDANHVRINEIDLTGECLGDMSAADEKLFQKDKLDKSEWSFKRVSSEVADGDNGRGKYAVDGVRDTYWYTKFKGGMTTNLPYINVDFKGEYEITGGAITMTGGKENYVKSFNLYVADKYGDWQLVHTAKNLPTLEFYRFKLSQPVRGKFFRLEITDAHVAKDETTYIRLNEIDLTGKKVDASSIDDVTAEADEHFSLYRGNDELLLESNVDHTDAAVALYRMDGTCVYAFNYDFLPCGQLVAVPMNQMQAGMYVLQCQTAEGRWIRKFVWNK